MIGILLLLTAAVGAPAPQFQIETLAGGSASGAILELSSVKGQLILDGPGGRKTLKLAEIRSIGPAEKSQPAAKNPPAKTPPAPAAWVQLLDGSRLAASEYEVKDGAARIKLAGGETVSLHTRSIRQVEFPAVGAAADWPVSADDATADFVIVRKKETLDPVDGVLGDVTADAARFTVGGETIPVKRARIAGFIYFHPADSQAAAEPLCVVQDAAGSQIGAKEITLADGKLRLVTTFGATLSRPLSDVRNIDFSASRVFYLSDMPIASTTWIPLIDVGNQTDALARFYRPRLDQAFGGGSLSAAGKTYRKGLSLACHSEVEFKLARKGQRFQAIAAIDDGQERQGAVRLKVMGDGKSLYDGPIAAKAAPTPLDLDVAGVRRLRIVVDFGQGMELGDYLDLCDARIVK